ncbi:MAG: hypothetical protein HYZ57_11520 [Acidobacteria bacterium]|nr:hypothetical protein [Acidobacteriota bacterium]
MTRAGTVFPWRAAPSREPAFLTSARSRLRKDRMHSIALVALLDAVFAKTPPAILARLVFATARCA